MTHSFPSPRHSIVTTALVAAFCLGLSLTGACQSVAPTGAPAGIPFGPGSVLKVAAAPGQPFAELPTTAIGKDESAKKPAGGVNQGIKMHGHWVIDIKNPDGTLSQHHEFENSLQYDGQQLLLGLLSGYASMGQWEIYFTAPTGGTSPCTSGTYPFCAIAQSTTYQPGAFACTVYTCVGGLTVTPTFGVGPSLVLSGSITAQNAGTVGSVGTGHNACGTTTSLSTTTPAACQTATTSGGYGGTMTYTSITPISVAAGQIIQVSVTLTFS